MKHCRSPKIRASLLLLGVLLSSWWCVLMTEAQLRGGTYDQIPRDSQDPTRCDAAFIPERKLKVIPTWVSSYPGSGARAAWKVVQAITGITADEDYTNWGHALAGTAVIIKTHYPSNTPEDLFYFYQNKLNVKQGILLVRNPLRALPSYHNFKYEKEHGLDNHSTRAPIDTWIKWRNENFQAELAKYVDHINWWMNNYDVNQGQLHVMIFERLLASTTGADEVYRLAKFLRGVDPVIADTILPPQSYDCVWEMVVQRPVPKNEVDPNAVVLRNYFKWQYPYTTEQLDAMVTALYQLRDQYQTKYPPLSQALLVYIQEIMSFKNRLLNVW